MIDLRSDTITRPTGAMRQAMAEAEVGDDVFGDDPTVNELQELVSGMLGKEAGLFVPSGTMANQLAIKAHTQPGDEVICEAGNHIFNYEAGAPAVLSSVQLFPIEGNDGVLSVEQIEKAIRKPNVHHPRTRLVSLENTHNRSGGTIYPQNIIHDIRRLCDANDLRLHLDGARLWNAHVATGLALADLAEPFDSVSVCFSKGLGTPIGSLLAGSAEFIESAHRSRKLLGGGMRQVGIIAAGAMYAVKNHIERLSDDHRRIKVLAEELNRFEAIKVNLESVQSNILYFEVDGNVASAEAFAEQLKKKGVCLLPVSAQMLRAVAHLDISDDDLAETIRVFKEIL